VPRILAALALSRTRHPALRLGALLLQPQLQSGPGVVGPIKQPATEPQLHRYRLPQARGATYDELVIGAHRFIFR
jgi:hypothetical protein